ncbi:MAG: hypothetical protein WC509_03895 [Candidatus Izemoplasmatales bacterium]
MSQWWEALSGFQQAMFVVAAIATAIMAIFLILMLFGIEGGEASAYGGDVDVPDVDADVDVDEINDEPLSAIGGLKIITIRGVLAFLAIGGWTAFSLGDLIHPLLASLCGLASGSLAAILLAIGLRAAMKLESEGNLDLKNAVGKIATVYLRVPKDRTAKGKVTLTVQERYVEADAVTDEHEDLPTGVEVEIVDEADENTLVVRRK